MAIFVVARLWIEWFEESWTRCLSPILKLEMGRIHNGHLIEFPEWMKTLSGPFLLSRIGDKRWTEHCAKVYHCTPNYHKQCWFIATAGLWSWKSKSPKECLTTHLPKRLDPKMDGAQAGERCPTTASFFCRWKLGLSIFRTLAILRKLRREPVTRWFH